MKKISTLLAAAAIAATANTMSAETVYCMPGTYQGWSLESNILTANADGTYTQHIDQLSGDFKIVRYEIGSPSWDNQWGSNGSGIEAGKPYQAAFKNGGPDPANIVLAGKSTTLKDVTVTLTPGDNDALTILLTAGEVEDEGDIWYLVGEATGWSFPATNRFTKTDATTYTFKYEGAFTGGFKPVKNASWSQAYVIDEPMVLGQEYTLNGPADTQTNCTLADASVENAVFTLVDNGSTVTLKVTTGAGVEAVEADAATGETVYYNLQGQRVANPENGLFIRLQGGKATKVAL